MNRSPLIVLLWIFCLGAAHELLGDFKANQMLYSHVREAYKDKESHLTSDLSQAGLDIKKLKIFLRAFKEEKVLEAWVWSKAKSHYVLFKRYRFCETSGSLGPKRRQGDLQIPEGLYYINRFNPSSKYYLSMGINYPNASDLVKARGKNPGGDIFIHGDCKTLGCIPITDDKIKELYILAIEAFNSGQKKIPVHIFPTRLSDRTLQLLSEEYRYHKSWNLLWRQLKKAYDFFQKKKIIPTYTIDPQGNYIITENQRS